MAPPGTTGLQRRCFIRPMLHVLSSRATGIVEILAQLEAAAVTVQLHM